MRKNYYPITSLTAVDKLFEQLLSHQLMCRYGKTLNSKMRAHRKKRAWTDRRSETGRWYKTTCGCFIY